MAQVAEGKNIEKVANDLYAVDDKSYYIQLPAGSPVPEIKKVNGGQALIMPADKGRVELFNLILIK